MATATNYSISFTNASRSNTPFSLYWDPMGFYVYTPYPYKKEEKHPLDKAFTPEQKKKFEDLFI